jgi:hypothetical protein
MSFVVFVQRCDLSDPQSSQARGGCAVSLMLSGGVLANVGWANVVCIN